MATNRMVFVSYLTVDARRFLTIGRQAGNKVYCGPTVASLRRISQAVNQSVDRGTTHIHLWADGWTACLLDGSN
jgi:hypothetical protein